MTALDSINLGTANGFDIRAEISPDLEGDYEYEQEWDFPVTVWDTGELHAAYLRGEWKTVWIDVIASRNGIELGRYGSGGRIYGTPVAGSAPVSPLPDDPDLPHIISEAVSLAQAKANRKTTRQETWNND